ncbi:MAG: glycosyltransferase [Promethearchaeota archaeon]
MRIISYSAGTWELRHGRIHQPTARWTILNRCFEKMGAVVENIRIAPARQFGYYAGYALSILKNIAKSVRRRRYVDLVLSYFPYMAPIGFFSGKLGGIPWVADWGDALIGSPVVEHFRNYQRSKYITIRFLERTILKSADRVVTNFVGLSQQLIGEGFDRNKVTAISDGVDNTLFVPPSSSHTREIDKLKEELGIKGKTMFYHGKIAKMYNLTRLVNALKIASKSIPDLNLLLVGDGDDVDGIKWLARKLNIEKYVTITGALPYEEMPRYVRLADVCILPFRGGALKIWEWCASGKPVIGFRGYLEMEGFIHNENAYLVDSPEEIANAVVRVLTDEDLAKRLGEGAAKIAMEHDWRKLSKEYFRILQDAVFCRD